MGLCGGTALLSRGLFEQGAVSPLNRFNPNGSLKGRGVIVKAEKNIEGLLLDKGHRMKKGKA